MGAKKEARKQAKDVLKFLDLLYESVREEGYEFDKYTLLSDIAWIEGKLGHIKKLLS